jgi:hypothetical protein
MSGKLFLRVCFLFCLPLMAGENQFRYLYSWILPPTHIVKDRKACASIILSEKPTKSAQFAAAELQYHFRLISGAEVPIINKVPERGTRIFVGDSAKYKSAEFKRQEYLVKVDSNDIFLVGRDEVDYRKVNYKTGAGMPNYWKERGSVYAVYDFLEVLGVRWYLPTELGIAFRPSKDISVKNMQIRRTPSYKTRQLLTIRIPADLCGDTVKNDNKPVPMLAWQEQVKWYLRRGAGGIRRDGVHTFYNYYKRFWPAHKEYFAQGRTPSRDTQLCYTNPRLIKQVVQDARDFFDGKMKNRVSKYLSNLEPDCTMDAFPMGAMDNTSWCKCPRCRKLILDKPTQGYRFSNNQTSEYWFTFVAAVATELKKSHPDKFIISQAYSSSTYPPDNVKLPDNVIVIPYTNILNVFSKAEMDYIQKLYRAWDEKYPNVKKQVAFWYCFPTFTAKMQNIRLFPHFAAHHVKTYFKWFKKFGADGMGWEPSYVYAGTRGGASPMMDMVGGYLNWKLAWNDSLDADKLYDEFFEKFFGPAAKPMRNFYTFAENVYSDPKNYPANYQAQNQDIAWNHLGSTENMKKLGEYVERAKKLAVTDPFKARVKLFDSTLWGYMKKGKEESDKMTKLRAPSMQESTVKYLKNSPNGDPEEVPWNVIPSLKVYGGLRAEPMPADRDIQVRVAHDGKWLYFKYTENKAVFDNMVTNRFVWVNDEWESFFAKQRGVPYNQFAVDFAEQQIGVYNDGIQISSWTFPGIIKHVKKDGEWSVYLAVKMTDIVPGGIKPGEDMYYNVIRSICKPKRIACVWVPTFGKFVQPDRLGKLILEPVK